MVGGVVTMNAAAGDVRTHDLGRSAPSWLSWGLPTVLAAAYLVLGNVPALFTRPEGHAGLVLTFALEVTVLLVWIVANALAVNRRLGPDGVDDDITGVFS